MFKLLGLQDPEHGSCICVMSLDRIISNAGEGLDLFCTGPQNSRGS